MLPDIEEGATKEEACDAHPCHPDCTVYLSTVATTPHRETRGFTSSHRGDAKTVTNKGE